MKMVKLVIKLRWGQVSDHCLHISISQNEKIFGFSFYSPLFNKWVTNIPKQKQSQGVDPLRTTTPNTNGDLMSNNHV